MKSEYYQKYAFIEQMRISTLILTSSVWNKGYTFIQSNKYESDKILVPQLLTV